MRITTTEWGKDSLFKKNCVRETEYTNKDISKTTKNLTFFHAQLKYNM